VSVAVVPTKNQNIEPETTTPTAENNDMDELEPGQELEPTIPDLDPDPLLTLTFGEKSQPIVAMPEIINSDEEGEGPMDHFDETFAEDEISDVIDEGSLDVPTSSNANTTNTITTEALDTIRNDLTENSEESECESDEEEQEPVPATVNVTATKPAQATPTSIRTLSIPTNSNLPSALRCTTPWQIENINIVLTAPKPFQCKTCLKFFSSKTGVHAHMRTHEEPKHCCEFCGRRFQIETVYKIHVRTHTGEKPYKCRFCDYKTAAHSSIYIHERIHPESGKQPYKRYRKNRRLTEYTETHTTCTVCNKTFSNVKNCHNHMYFVHEKDPSKGLPFTCTICNSTFAYKSNTVAHVKSTHSDEVNRIGATTSASILTNFILLDESLLPPKLNGPKGYQSRGHSRVDYGIQGDGVNNESSFQDLSAVITRK